MLSTTYHPELFWSVIATKNFERLKNLALSSSEMSNAFFGFMKNVCVRYTNGCIMFYEPTTSSRDDALYKFGNGDDFFWIVTFVRNFAILLNYTRGLDAFAEKVLCSGSLLFLDISVRTWTETKNLEIVTAVPRLMISNQQVKEVKPFMPNFDSLRIVNFNPKYDRDIEALNLDSQGSQLTILHEEASYHSSYVEILQDLKDKLLATRNFCFMWLDDGHYDVLEDFQTTINAMKTFPSQIHQITIVIFGRGRFFGDTFQTAIDYWENAKDEYDTLIANLLDIPEHIKVKADILMKTSDGFDGENPHDLLAPFFSSQDFTVTFEESTPRSLVTIMNRQKQVRNNVEFNFEYKSYFLPEEDDDEEEDLIFWE